MGCNLKKPLDERRDGRQTDGRTDAHFSDCYRVHGDFVDKYTSSCLGHARQFLLLSGCLRSRSFQHYPPMTMAIKTIPFYRVEFVTVTASSHGVTTSICHN